MHPKQSSKKSKINRSKTHPKSPSLNQQVQSIKKSKKLSQKTFPQIQPKNRPNIVEIILNDKTSKNHCGMGRYRNRQIFME